MAKPDLICVGAVSGAFGVRGEVRIKSFCADPAAIGDYSPLFSQNGKNSYEIELTRNVKGGFAAKLGALANKEDADAMRGTRLYVPRQRLPSLPDDEYYHSDLIGLKVVDTGGATCGKVTAVHDHGAGDILEISAPNLKEPALLPFTREAVPTVDLAAKCIVIDPPEGMFPA